MQEVLAPLKEALITAIAEARVIAEEHVNVYEKYMRLIDGTAATEVDEFVAHDHKTADYANEIRKYAAITKELQFDCVAMVRKGLFTVSCKSFIKDLMKRTSDLQGKLLTKFRETFQKTKEELRAKFSAIADLALETPEVCFNRCIVRMSVYAPLRNLAVCCRNRFVLFTLDLPRRTQNVLCS